MVEKASQLSGSNVFGKPEGSCRSRERALVKIIGEQTRSAWALC
jgi:hypothetical protein